MAVTIPPIPKPHMTRSYSFFGRAACFSAAEALIAVAPIVPAKEARMLPLRIERRDVCIKLFLLGNEAKIRFSAKVKYPINRKRRLIVS